ncbi:MAG: anti-sigma factor family protein [Chloroflexaceae bacterium]
MQSSPDNHLSDSDLELLSAYIDNALSVAERTNLERRLAADPRLRAELEELQATTQLLRQLAPVRPPRSFTLDPATAPRPAPAFRLSWFMQLGSGLVGLALVVLATVQLLASAPNVVGVMPPASAAVDVAPMGAKTAPEAEMYAPASTPVARADGASTPVDAAPLSQATAPSTPDSSAARASVDSAAQAPPAASPSPAARSGFLAGFTLALGVALIALALAWRFMGR